MKQPPRQFISTDAYNGWLGYLCADIKKCLGVTSAGKKIKMKSKKMGKFLKTPDNIMQKRYK